MAGSLFTFGTGTTNEETTRTRVEASSDVRTGSLQTPGPPDYLLLGLNTRLIILLKQVSGGSGARV
jgi:hypothetical protein